MSKYSKQAIAPTDLSHRPLLEPHVQGTESGAVMQAILIQRVSDDGKRFVPSHIELMPLPIEKFGSFFGEQYNWGRYDAGTRLLSFNLLVWAQRRPGKRPTDAAKKIAAAHATAFCDQVVSALPDRWCLTQKQVKAWLKAQPQTVQALQPRRRSIAPKTADDWVGAMEQACDRLSLYLEQMGRALSPNDRIDPNFADMLLMLQTLKSLAIARQSILNSPYWQDATCRAKTTAWVEVLKLEQGIKSAIFQFKTAYMSATVHRFNPVSGGRLQSLDAIIGWVTQDEYVYQKLLKD